MSGLLAALSAAGAALRLVSTRLPYRRAGLAFETGPERGLGYLVVTAGQLTEGGIEQLLGDANIDVSIGIEGGGFAPVADAAAFEVLATRIAELREHYTSTAAGDTGAPAPASETQPPAGVTPAASGTAAAGEPATGAPEVARTPGPGEGPGEQQPAADQAAPPVVAPIASAVKPPAKPKAGAKAKAAAKAKTETE